MADSMKDALEKAGLAAKSIPTPTPRKRTPEVPEDDGKPYVPFDAPALFKPKERPKQK